jgi:hypothetical protein
MASVGELAADLLKNIDWCGLSQLEGVQGYSALLGC